MSTESQINANRQNAQHSTGPKTSEGRAAVRYNALKHGLTSSSAIIPGEDPVEFAATLDTLRAEHQPEGEMEDTLVGQIALCTWRLRRCHKIEAGEYKRLLAEHKKTLPDPEAPIDEDLFMAQAYGESKVLDRIVRYEAGVLRQMEKCRKLLTGLQSVRTKQSQSEAEVEAIKAKNKAKLDFEIEKRMMREHFGPTSKEPKRNSGSPSRGAANKTEPDPFAEAVEMLQKLGKL